MVGSSLGGAVLQVPSARHLGLWDAAGAKGGVPRSSVTDLHTPVTATENAKSEWRFPISLLIVLQSQLELGTSRKGSLPQLMLPNYTRSTNHPIPRSRHIILVSDFSWFLSGFHCCLAAASWSYFTLLELPLSFSFHLYLLHTVRSLLAALVLPKVYALSALVAKGFSCFSG